MTDAWLEARDEGTRLRIEIRDESDVVIARNRGRELALLQGSSASTAQALATAITEVARNALVHGGGGVVDLHSIVADGRRGVAVQVRDQGPGIADLALAMKDGYSSTGTLGLGLAGAQRLVDEFEIRSGPGQGTTMSLRMWAEPARLSSCPAFAVPKSG